MTEKQFKQKVTTSINLEFEEVQQLEKIRWRDRKSTANIMRRAIQEYIYNHAEGNECFVLDKWNEDPDFKVVPSLSSKSERWYQFIQECSMQELTDIMVATKRINDQCQAEARKKQ